VELGFITRAFGIKGGVELKLFSPHSEAIKAGVSLIVRKNDIDQELKVQQLSPQGHLYFLGIENRTEAEKLRGSLVLIERSALPPLADDEFYLRDIIGASVQLIDGSKIGEVVDFSTNNAQTLLEIKTVAGHIASVPLVKAIVKDIDAKNKVIIIDPPTGLLDT